MKFPERVYQEFTNTDTSPGVKSLTFHFESTMEMFGYFIEEMNEKLPSLESLTLFLETTDDDGYYYEPMWDGTQDYSPMYFDHLKKLSLRAFGDEANRIFDYMNISNNELEELSFAAYRLTRENLKWIKSCNKLSKLALECPCLAENELTCLKGMKDLEEVCLKVNHKFEWDTKKMIKFIRNNRQLKLLSIECERRNRQLKFDDEFKKMFDKLVQERVNVTVVVTSGTGDTKRQMKMSKDGFVGTAHFDEPIKIQMKKKKKTKKESKKKNSTMMLEMRRLWKTLMTKKEWMIRGGTMHRNVNHFILISFIIIFLLKLLHSFRTLFFE